MCESDITLVYKTYQNDLQWLKYSLLSVKKYLSNYKYIIIYCHDVSCGPLNKIIEEVNIKCRIIPVHYNFNGYIKQMTVKCECYIDVVTKYITIIDCDVIFKDFFDLSKLMDEEGKIYFTYSKKTMGSNGPEWIVWKKSFEEMTKTNQDVHFMTNGFPFTFTRKSMEDAAKHFEIMHNKNYSDFCIERLNIRGLNVEANIVKNFRSLAEVFEEFEWLGFYCKNYSNEYIFSDQYNFIRPSTKQFWSHGSITNEIMDEITQILN
jgi:hypothetical protein